MNAAPTGTIKVDKALHEIVRVEKRYHFSIFSHGVFMHSV
jgi:hypothetical protein